MENYKSHPPAMLSSVKLLINNIYLFYLKCFLFISLLFQMAIMILWENNGSCHVSSGIPITMMDILSIKISQF